NAAIEPLRAEKTLAGTAEAEVVIHAPAAVAERLLPYRDELAALLIVARATVTAAADGDALRVEVMRTSLPRCARCRTYRDDVAAGGAQDGLCARCTAVLA